MATYYATANQGSDVYFGPNSSLYAKVGSIGSTEKVEVTAFEKGFYYISYTAGSAKKRGFVPQKVLTPVTSLPTISGILKGTLGYVYQATSVSYGLPISTYPIHGQLGAKETVTIIERSIDNYTGYSYVEYASASGIKRGYVQNSNLLEKGGMLAYAATDATVYCGPSDNYVQSGSVSQNEYVIVTKSGTVNSEQWLQIEYNAGAVRKRGFVKKDAIAFVGSGTYDSLGIGTSYAKTTNGCIVYSGPGEEYAVAGNVAQDEVVLTLASETLANEEFREIDFWTAGGRKRGYVRSLYVSPPITLPHTIASDCDVYAGPGTDGRIYAKIGSVSANERVKCLAKDGNTFIIDYIAASQLKRGYVLQNNLQNYASIAVDLTEYSPSGYLDFTADGTYTVYTGPNASTYAVLGTLYPNESLTVIGSEVNGFAHVEYSSSSGTKRGYINASYLQHESIGVLAYCQNDNPVYMGPDAENSSVFVSAGRIYAGEYCIVIEELPKSYFNASPAHSSYSNLPEWYYIEYNSSDGRKRGYVLQDDIQLLGSRNNLSAERGGDYVAKATQTIEVKYGPGSHYAFVGTISKGEKVSLFETRAGEGGFVYIEYCIEATSNYVKRGYVQRSLLTPITLSIPTPETSIPALPSGAGSLSVCGKYGTSGRGLDLNYYRIGQQNTSKALVLAFAIHGYEDAWAADGIELVKIANKLVDHMSGMSNTAWTSEWSLYVIPAVNPDGIVYGYTHCGPGRASVTSKIDMNRGFPTTLSPFIVQTSRRNFTGLYPNDNMDTLLPVEAESLKDFLTDLRTRHSQVNLLDMHGWLNSTYGDQTLAAPFISALGLGGHSSTYGHGYLSTYVAGFSGCKAALIEYPLPDVRDEDSASYHTMFHQYANGTIRAVCTLLGITDPELD